MISNLRKPAFVIFDYGETLAHEDDYLPSDGFSAILKYAIDNPKHADGEALHAAFRECFFDLRIRAHAAGVEIPNMQRWRWLFELFGLRFSLPMDELETIYWNAAAPCIATPGIKDFLSILRESGVGTGVISNMGFSGVSLRRRLERLFPDHRFQFVFSSADYVLRKPNRRLFDLALMHAGCRAEDAWFAGDNPEMDILGAAGAGMVPVYYDRDLGCAYREIRMPENMPPHIRIGDWSELHGVFRP